MKIKIPGKTAEETKTIVLDFIRDTSHGLEAREQRIKGNYFFFVLRMAQYTPTRKAERADQKSPAMMYRKRRTGFSNGWTGAVCFHGHKHLMQRIFFWYPQAVIRTTMAAYIGKAGFEDRWGAVESKNIGSQYNPTAYGDACECLDDFDWEPEPGWIDIVHRPTEIRTMKHSDLRKCPFTIFVPDHYRADGSCKCNNAEHRQFMIKNWEYTPEAFANIPLVD